MRLGSEAASVSAARPLVSVVIMILVITNLLSYAVQHTSSRAQCRCQLRRYRIIASCVDIDRGMSM